MAEESGTGDRTEAATPRRLLRAREDGNVPLSREVPVFAGLAAATAVLALAGPALAHDLAARLAALLADAARLSPAAGIARAAAALGRAAGPPIAAGLLATAAAVLLQTGFLIHAGALRPQLSRIDPRAGIGRLFGVDGLLETGRALLKLALTAFVLRAVLLPLLPALEAAPLRGTAALPGLLAGALLRLLAFAAGLQAVLAGADLLVVRLRHARALRMSREDLRQEHKDSEGDPRVKGRLKQLRMARARRRMMAAVPKAAVVVTNPTHYAVALAYDRGAAGRRGGGAAPRVVAKGVDSLAARIRETAAASGVPLVANPPLARALHGVELDAEIPAEHYQAVAEIIAYVWGLARRASRPVS